MLFGVIALVVAAAPLPQQVDTVIAVRAGTRVQIENFNGSTTVRTWEKSQVRIVAEGDERNRVDLRNLGDVLTVKSQSRYGSPRSVDYEITVPVRTDLTVGGVYNDVSVDGVQGAITVETVNGDVSVRGGNGFISLKSIEGGVELSDAKGRITLSSTNDDVSVENSSGDITVDAINGEVSMRGITSASVTASSVNGDIWYDGSIQDGGQYSLSTHNGDVDITIPDAANATVDVATFNGEFEGPPVTLSRMSRNRFTFVLGTGKGRLNLESFQGTIRLHRPGDLRRGSGGGTGSGSASGSNNSNRNRDREREKDKNKDRYEEQR